MKKAVSLFLALILCLSLCACKSKEAKDAETLIATIGEVTIESKNTITAAREAYDKLSVKEQESVENYDLLVQAEEILLEIRETEALIAAIGEVTVESKSAIAAAREAYDKLSVKKQAAVENYDLLVQAEEILLEIRETEALIAAIGEVTVESKSAIAAAREAYDKLSVKKQAAVENYNLLVQAENALFAAELYTLANRIIEISIHCEHVALGNKVIWRSAIDNQPSSISVAETFWALYRAVRTLDADLTMDEYDEKLGTTSRIMMIGAAIALRSDKFSEYFNMSSKERDNLMEEVIDLCVDFNNSYSFIEENMDILAEDVRIFRDAHKEKHSDEVTTLNDWCIELSMYADFALEPEGSLQSYTTKVAEYENSMEHFIKIMDSYY